jgi:hypothetical protein
VFLYKTELASRQEFAARYGAAGLQGNLGATTFQVLFSDDLQPWLLLFALMLGVCTLMGYAGYQLGEVASLFF